MPRQSSVSSLGGNALVSDPETSKAILRRVNWDFRDRRTPTRSGSIPFKCSEHFWGPAAFIPEIPYTLIEVLSQPGASVYDPFAGVGTTYFQALLLGRRPMATEICAVNIQYMLSLLRLFDPQIRMETLEQSITSMIAAYDPHADYANAVPDGVLFSKLRPWYSQKTLNQLAFLFEVEAGCADASAKAAISISISCILRTVSSQERGWGCVADNVLPKPHQIKDKDATKLFSAHLRKLLHDVGAHVRGTPPGYTDVYRVAALNPMILHQDVRGATGIPDGSVDLLVTSPPYPNMTDYANSRRLSYYHIGADPSVDSKLEIGARIRRTAKGALDSYLADMESADASISRKLKKGGYACYVMPVFGADNENNVSRRRIVQKVMAKLEDYDLVKEEEYDRILPMRRRQHNSKWATLERERIHLFRKV